VRTRILLAGTETAGHYTGLAEGFRLLGMQPTLAATPNRFEYAGNYSPNLILSVFHKVQKNRRKTSKAQLLSKIFFIGLEAVLGSVLPFWVIVNYDTVFFCFGETYTNKKWELWLYKIFKVRIAFTFHGSDARPVYLNGEMFPRGTPVNWRLMKIQNKRLKNKIERIELYADAIFAYPGISHFFTRPFFDSTIFGNPVILPTNARLPEVENSTEKVIVLHCPSSPESKGSSVIREIIRKLREEGLDVELKELIGVPNMMVHDALSKADIVVDSMWNDSPAGTFPAEALNWHKPVVIGSYFADSYPDYYHMRGLNAPYIFCKPEEVFGELKSLIESKTRRKELAAKAADYVNSDGKLETIAKKYLMCLSGMAPATWLCDPRTLSYLWGYGASCDNLKSMVEEYVRNCGVEALNLPHRPDLEEAFSAFQCS
jgi:hypothetical protein